MWQAEADTELTLSASPATAVGQKALALAKRRYSTVIPWTFLNNNLVLSTDQVVTTDIMVGISRYQI